MTLDPTQTIVPKLEAMLTEGVTVVLTVTATVEVAVAPHDVVTVTVYVP